MAGMIPQSFIDELLARVDVVDVVDSRVKLKKAGKNYSACCPFHNENTPSFTVSPDKQFYYCFGCGASGTALKFVMEYDGLNFPDAVEKLADQVNLPVPREESSREQIEQEKQHSILFKHMEEASQFYEQQLREHPQKDKAIAYLKGRGLSGKAAKFFGIGYAPPGWDALQTTLGKERKDIKELISCGMLIEKEDGRTYDRFRDRIMFPIRDARGRFIAFGGRVLGDEKPKYLNSPETPIFHKNRELYGLYEARKVRQKLTRFVIVEGYMDVVALAEFGIHYAVATLGTATSEHHLRRLFKIVPEVIFCFDGDQAGKTAAARAMETVLPVLTDAVQARFLFLPDGEDPDTLVRQEGKEQFEQRLNESIHLPEFLFDHLKQQVDFDTMNGKARLGELAAPLINKLSSGLLRDMMEKQLAKLIDVERSSLEELIAKKSQAHQQPEPMPEPSALVPEYLQDQPPEEANEQAIPVEQALISIVQKPNLATQIQLPDNLEAESEQERLLIEVINKLHNSPQQSSIGLIMQWTGSPYQETFKTLANREVDIGASSGGIQQILDRLAARKDDKRLQDLEWKYNARLPLTDEEREEFKALKKLKQIRNKKRTGIFSSR